MKQLLRILVFCLYSFGIFAQTFTQRGISDYVSFLGVLKVEAGDYDSSNGKLEYDARKIEDKIKEYRNMIEGN